MSTLDKNLKTNLSQLDVSHHLHPFSDYKAMKAEGVRIITDAEGHYIIDSSGKRIIDGMAGLWCVNVGYGRRELIDAATEQLSRMPYYNTFFKTSNTPAALLSERLTGIAPDGFSHVFFANSGSEANDTIVRMARHFWAVEGKPSKRVIISREFAYHGSTVAAAGMGGMVGMHSQAGSAEDMRHIRAPYGFRYRGEMDEASFAETAASWLEDEIMAIGADKVAAFIAEPIQGSGGVIVPPAGYFEHIQRICRKHNILLIADEVITGYGRTGEWFACQTLNIAADFITTAKGLTSGYIPMSAVLVGDRVATALIEEEGDFHHGFTYSGHPVGAAVALANLEVIEKEGLIKRVREETAPHLAEALTRLSDHPLVGEVRSFGLLGGIELVKDKDSLTGFDNEGETGAICRNHATERGLMMRAMRDVMLLSPPLTFTCEDIDTVIDLALMALDDTLKTLNK